MRALSLAIGLQLHESTVSDLITRYWDQIFLNDQRETIQVLDCHGDVFVHVPLRTARSTSEM